MWLLKLLLKHTCIIGDRCKKFHCTSLGYPLHSYSEKGYIYSLHFEKIHGKDVPGFLTDLKKDSKIVELEAHNDTVFFLYKSKEKSNLPGQMSMGTKKIFHTKPVFVDIQGYEHWEVAAWNREDLSTFIIKLKKDTHELQEFKILQLVKTKINDLFFPQLMPAITAHQRKAFDLAIKEGYYEFPRKTELEKLAQIMHISLSTYREHLRLAEKTLLPYLRQTMVSE
ncbi:MAG: helix-turn-helix domain-containing protein [Candidatus Woesearchaeota archaeon]|jgi:predicted DNA binding protein